MARQVRFRVLDGVAVVSLDAPPVNALSAPMRAGLWQIFDRVAGQGDITAVVLRAEGRIFSAGADIREFAAPPSGDAPSLPQLCDRIEACPKPVVAALHAQALGGGAELALACHYRVAGPHAQISLPEIHLGLLPGAGGTQRLPRVVGVETALDMILTGRGLDGPSAFGHGLVDAVVEGDVATGAVTFARKLVADGAGPRPTRQRREAFEDGRGDQRHVARIRKARAEDPIFATHLIIDAVEAATLLPFEAGCAFEADAFARCLVHPQSVALRHIFMAERKISPDLLARTERGFVPTAEAGRGVVLRLRKAMRGAAQALSESEGLEPEAIDAALVTFGFRKGPFGGRGGGGSARRVVRPILAALISEGAACIADGAAQRPSDIDALAVHGLGFPRKEGGPFRAVQTIGLLGVLNDMRHWSEDNLLWEPPDLLSEAVKDAAGFDRFNG